MLNHFKLACNIAFTQPIVLKSIKISLVVGTVLNIINQGDIIFSDNIADISYFKFFLTYVVPYSVTTYTATTMKMQFQIGTKAIISADLKCKVCNYHVHVEKDEIIPECPKCGVKTHWKLENI